MQALAVVGYIVLAIGIALFVLTAAKRLVDGELSKIKLFDKIELTIPASLVLAGLGAVLAALGTLGPALTGQQPEAGVPLVPVLSTTSSATPSATAQAQGVSLAISEPTPGMLVPEDGFPVSGTSNLQVTDRLWVVYRGINNPNPSFQPQSRACRIAVDGAFTCPPQYVGGPDDGGKGHKFELLFFLADSSASQVFVDYEASNPKARGYPGLAELPSEGLQYVGGVTVERQ